MTVPERLQKAITESEYSYEQLEVLTGIPRSSLQRYATGNTKKIPIDAIEKVAPFLNVTAPYLMGWSEERPTPTVPAAAVAAAERILTKLPMYEVPVSAGTGAWLADGYEYEFVEFEDAPHDADYALRVRGDSMEPMYSDGDTVFVRTNIMVESGQVGVFVLNGEGYMKMLQGNRLVSMNPKYKPMVIEEWDEFWVAGRVVGRVTELRGKL